MLDMMLCPDGQKRRDSGLYVTDYGPDGFGVIASKTDPRLIDLQLHGYGPRGIDPGSNTGNSQNAFGDVQYYEFVYNDVSGSLSIGMPVYVDVRDAAEWNSKYSATALSPTAGRTGGNVVLGTTAAGVGTNPLCVGLFAPDDQNIGLLPNKGDVIRVLAFGRGIVSAQSPAAGSAGNVGSNLVASTVVAQAVPGARSTGLNIGILLATRTFVANTNTIFAAASATTTLANVFVAPS
jgi:hypothetical protein